MKDKRQESFVRLQHVLKSIQEVEKFTMNSSENKFVGSDILSSAVLFQFSVIGEAIIHVEDELLNKYNYPWHKVRSFRNMIAHEYFNIKLTAVWKIVVNDIPQLKPIIQSMLTNEF